MPSYTPDLRRAYATAALTGVAPFQGAAEDTARKANAAPPADPLDELYASGVLPGRPASAPQLAPPPVPLGGMFSAPPGQLPAGLDPAKTLAQMGAAQTPRQSAPSFGAGDFGVSLQGTDPIIGAGINIRDTPEVQLAKMQLHAGTAAGESAAANAAQQNALHAQGLQQQQLSDFGRQQLGQSNLGLEQKKLGMSQTQLQQAAEQFNKTQDLELKKIKSHEDIEKGKIGPQAMQAAGNAAVFQAIANSIGKPGGPRNAVEAKRTIDAIIAGGQPNAAAPGAMATAGSAGASAPLAGPKPQPIDDAVAQFKASLGVDEKGQFSPNGPSARKAIQAIATRNLTPQQQTDFYNQLFSDPSLGNKNGLAEAIMRGLAGTVTNLNFGVAGAPGQAGSDAWYAPAKTLPTLGYAGLPGFQMAPAQTNIVGAVRQALTGNSSGGRYRSASFGGLTVPNLNLEDVSNPTMQATQIPYGSQQHKDLINQANQMSNFLREMQARGVLQGGK